jgi:hypothetical protein
VRTRASISFFAVAALAALWCIAFPFYWAYNLTRLIQLPYETSLYLFLPQLIIAAVVVVCLVLAFFRKRVAVAGFVIAAISVPVLALGIGSPSSGVWPISAALLLLLAWRSHVYIAAQA